MESRGTRRYNVRDSIVRTTDYTINKDEVIEVCLTGVKIEHVAERVQRITGLGNGGILVVHIGTNNTDKEGTSTIVKKLRNLLFKEHEGSEGTWTDYLIRAFTNVWNQEQRIN